MTQGYQRITEHSLPSSTDQELTSMGLQQGVGGRRASSPPLAGSTFPKSTLTILQQMAMGHMQMKQMPTKNLDH